MFFKSILNEPEVKLNSTPPAERRTIPRYAINPHFQLKAVLNYSKRTESRPPKPESRPAWTWPCRILDCSEQGVRLLMDPGPKVQARDLCDLKLSIENFDLTIPCRIANVHGEAQGLILGLKHEITDEQTWSSYWQLLEVIALSSTLKPQRRTTKPDESGYIVEHYVNDRPARLTIWRHPASQAAVAFEFRLKDNLVRGSAGQKPGYLTGLGGSPAPVAQAAEIHRLFQWVVANLAVAVPDDVRDFLRTFSG
jgi:hypothetical protein